MYSDEHNLQTACVRWFRLNYRRRGYIIASIPNGGARTPVMGAWYKAEGLLAGIADLVVILDAGRVLWVEMKTAKGRQTPSQRDFQQRVEQLGHTYLLARSLDEFMALITKAIDNERAKRIHENTQLAD